jgi:3-oxoacyl-[acyl-carrier-protein] synthase II
VRRVAITGVGLVTPLGDTLAELEVALLKGQNATQTIDTWNSPHLGLLTRLAAPVRSFQENQFDRKWRRTMSRVAMMAVSSAGKCIEDAQWTEEWLRSEDTAVSFGSSMGGTKTMEECFGFHSDPVSLLKPFEPCVAQPVAMKERLHSTSFLKMMPHTCAANIAIRFQIPGRLLTPCVACASSTQAVGMAYELIASGHATRVLAGGADELTPTVAGIFDVLGATSTQFNTHPELSPKPFDKNRDGIVVGEGSVTFALEDWEVAQARGASIYAEVVGFYTNNDASHMTNPSQAGLEKCMKGALRNAGLQAAQIQVVNAHAAGTTNGDSVEGRAIEAVFGTKTPVHSLKGNFGHLMGAAGGAELVATLIGLKNQLLFPTLNLTHLDPDCGSADFVTGEPRSLKHSFGGVNSCLVLKKGSL